MAPERRDKEGSHKKRKRSKHKERGRGKKKDTGTTAYLQLTGLAQELLLARHHREQKREKKRTQRREGGKGSKQGLEFLFSRLGFEPFGVSRLRFRALGFQR